MATSANEATRGSDGPVKSKEQLRKEFGLEMKQARLDARDRLGPNISMAAIAREWGVKAGQYRLWEGGERKVPPHVLDQLEKTYAAFPDIVDKLKRAYAKAYPRASGLPVHVAAKNAKSGSDQLDQPIFSQLKLARLASNDLYIRGRLEVALRKLLPVLRMAMQHHSQDEEVAHLAFACARYHSQLGRHLEAIEILRALYKRFCYVAGSHFHLLACCFLSELSCLAAGRSAIEVDKAMDVALETEIIFLAMDYAYRNFDEYKCPDSDEWPGQKRLKFTTDRARFKEALDATRHLDEQWPSFDLILGMRICAATDSLLIHELADLTSRWSTRRGSIDRVSDPFERYPACFIQERYASVMGDPEIVLQAVAKTKPADPFVPGAFRARSKVFALYRAGRHDEACDEANDWSRKCLAVNMLQWHMSFERLARSILGGSEWPRPQDRWSPVD